MNPTLQQLLAPSFPRHELAALADVEVEVSLRIGSAAATPVVLGGRSVRLVHVGHDKPLALGRRGMLCIELGGGALRVDVPVEVVAAGVTSSMLRVLATPLVLRRRMVRDQKLGEAVGVAAANHARVRAA